MIISGRDGLDKLFARMGGKRFVDSVGQTLYVAADMVRSEAFRSISRGSVSGKNHLPSAPGTPPNRDSGVLQANLIAERTGPLEAEVRSEAPYSAPLEFGSSKAPARPFMRPARDLVKDKVGRLVARNLSRDLKD